MERGARQVLRGKVRDPRLVRSGQGRPDRNTQDDADPAAISQKRADNAKDYLVTKGITAGRLTTQAYGADWAKAATTKGASEPKNRRVQIWVK